MEISPARTTSSGPTPVYGRMRRLADAIADPDSTPAQRARWQAEHVELSARLVGEVGARTAGGADLVDRMTRVPEARDGRVPRVPDCADADPRSTSLDRYA